jgi:subtilase-type serine protease
MSLALNTIACAAAALAVATPAVAQQQFMDPEFNAQWGLAAVGAQYALAKGLTGAGVAVGGVDGIFQTTHPEFAGRIYPYTFNPYDRQNDTHGTHVAGIIGAARNGVGMEGVAPGVRLSAIDAFVDNDELAGGFKDAVSAGIRIFNNSWGRLPPQEITTYTRATAAAEVVPCSRPSARLSVQAACWSGRQAMSIRPIRTFTRVFPICFPSSFPGGSTSRP